MTTGVHVFTSGIFTHLDALFDRQYIADLDYINYPYMSAKRRNNRHMGPN